MRLTGPRFHFIFCSWLDEVGDHGIAPAYVCKGEVVSILYAKLFCSKSKFSKGATAMMATGDAQRRAAAYQVDQPGREQLHAAASQPHVKTSKFRHATLGQLPHPPGKVSMAAAVSQDAAASQDAAVRQDLERRLRKRLEAVAAIKRTPEYNDAYVYGNEGGDFPFPSTPDPTDLTISKRTWEKSVMQWRASLRLLAARHHS